MRLPFLKEVSQVNVKLTRKENKAKGKRRAGGKKDQGEEMTGG